MKIEKTKNNLNRIHAGHRQRLKEKAVKIGLKNLEKHEALELLLTYAIPQKNTNPLAHVLLNQFKNFYNICNASVGELMSVPGVGPECARFLNLMLEFSELILKDKNENINILSSIQRCVDYFRNNYRVKDCEAGYVICLNARNKIIKTLEFEGKSEVKVMFDFREVVKQLVAIKAYGIIIIHTHPNGNVTPTEDDNVSTFQMLKQCMMINVKVYDHLIFNEFTYYSMQKEITKFLEYLNKNFKGLLAGDSYTLQQVLKETKE